MFRLARLLQLAGNISWRLRTPSKRFRPTALCPELLEDRIVPTLLGQQLFPADYPWNQNISNAPVAANSAAIIAHIGNSIGIHPDWGEDSPANGNSSLYGIPVNVVHGNSVAKVNVVIDDYPDESNIVPVPIPANAVIEGDFQNGPNLNGPGYNANQRGDSLLLIWDEDNNIAYELYEAARPTDAVTADGAPTGGVWHAAQESVWYMNTDSFRNLGDTSADAAGLSILAGLARPDEGLPIAQGGQGAIDHALRFTLPSGDVDPQYIYPASHVVNTSSGSTKLPFGSRLRLLNTPAVNSAISKLGPEAQIIAHAMQQYGLVLADIGSAMYVTGDSDSVDANNNLNLTWNMDDVLGLHALTAGDFQVVSLTPVVTGLSATGGVAGNTVTVIGQNFSGAAGHLAVYFGNTPATSVTVVDDSHITAVVPAGSGTVNVTVLSGVIEADPNNASDNANNPVFGYGQSAVTSADQFIYGGTPAVPVGPTGVVATDSPTFTWTAATGINRYYVLVIDAANGQVAASNSNVTATSWTTNTPLTPGHGYTWYVATVNSSGVINWVLPGLNFNVAPLAVPTVTGPVGTIAASSGFDLPTFTWTSVPQANHYYVLIVDNTTGQSSASNPNATGTSWTVGNALTPGHSFTWYIAAISNNGLAATWTAAHNFTLAPLAAPIAVGPNGNLTPSAGYDMPTYTWNAVPGANHYYAFVVDQAGNQVAAVNANVVGTSWKPTTVLTPGHHYAWYVAAVSTNGVAITWNAGQAFALPLLVAPVTSTVPSGNPPNFTWSSVAGADHYYVLVIDQTTGQLAAYNPSVAGTSWMPSTALTKGHTYVWYVGAISTNGQVATWSAGMTFGI